MTLLEELAAVKIKEAQAHLTKDFKQHLYDANPDRMTKTKLLDAAKATVADRGVAYGGVEDNFSRIAALWNTHIRNAGIVDPDCWARELTAVDVATMMVLMKVARLENQPNHPDSWTDIAGYAACGAEISQDLPKPA